MLKGAARKRNRVLLSEFKKLALLGIHSARFEFRKANLIVVCPVDDLVIFERTKADIKMFHDDMRQVFEIRDVGKPDQFLRRELTWVLDKAAGIRQSTHIENLRRAIVMEDCMPTDSPINPM